MQFRAYKGQQKTYNTIIISIPRKLKKETNILKIFVLVEGSDDQLLVFSMLNTCICWLK